MISQGSHKFTQTVFFQTNWIFASCFNCSCEWFMNKFVHIQLYKWNPVMTDDNYNFIKYLPTSWMGINLQITAIKLISVEEVHRTAVCSKCSNSYQRCLQIPTSSELQLSVMYSNKLLMQPEHEWNWLVAIQFPELYCTSLRHADRISYSPSSELYGVLISACSLGFSSLLEPVHTVTEQVCDSAGMHTVHTGNR